MSRLTRDGKAEPVSRDQILRHYGDGGIFIFPVQLTTSRIGNLSWLINTLAIRDYHTYMFLSRICLASEKSDKELPGIVGARGDTV